MTKSSSTSSSSSSSFSFSFSSSPFTIINAFVMSRRVRIWYGTQEAGHATFHIFAARLLCRWPRGDHPSGGPFTEHDCPLQTSHLSGSVWRPRDNMILLGQAGLTNVQLIINHFLHTHIIYFPDRTTKSVFMVIIWMVCSVHHFKGLTKSIN